MPRGSLRPRPVFSYSEGQGQVQPLGPNDPFTVAVNMTTIETAPIFVAGEGPQGAGFRITSGGVRNLANGSAHAATNAETQMLLIATTNPNVPVLLTVAEGLYRIVARKSAGINALADLRGKKIVTPAQHLRALPPGEDVGHRRPSGE